MSKITWKPGKGGTWRQKLEAEHPNHGRILPVPPRMQKTFGTGTMLIPRPRDVDALMRKARKGTLLTRSQIRDALARDAGADSACPLTTGIFMRIAAEAAEETLRAGKKRVTPYWRTLNDDGTLNEKYPGGAQLQASRLRAEGFSVVKIGRKLRMQVKDFSRHLGAL